MTATSLDRFTAAIELADGLPDPTEIYRAIMAGSREVDDGLRAAAYDSDSVSGGATSSHPERMLARRHPDQFPTDDDEPGRWGSRTDRAADDLLALRRATDLVLDSISALNAECCDAGTADDWEAALKDAHLLAEAGYLTAALDVGRHIDHWLIRFAHAVDTVRAIRDSWMAHEPTQDLAESNQPWCRPCQRIKDHKGQALQRPRVTKVCCQRCWRDILDLEGSVRDEDGDPLPAVDLQTDPRYWPSEAMTRAREDGRRVLFDREKQAWLRAHGVDPAMAQRRRAERRSA